MRLQRLRFELRMELAAEIPGVILEFADLDIGGVRRLSRDAQAVAGKPLLEIAVELVAVTMALADLRRAVGLRGEASFGQLARVRAQAHGAAQLIHALQLTQFVDHAMRRRGIELGGIGALHSADVARELDHHRLHAEANSEVRNLLLAREANGIDHAFDAALAESARHQNS